MRGFSLGDEFIALERLRECRVIVQKVIDRTRILDHKFARHPGNGVAPILGNRKYQEPLYASFEETPKAGFRFFQRAEIFEALNVARSCIAF